MITGAKMDNYYDLPHLRWHKSFEEYPSHLSDIDDIAFDRVDQYERLKKYNPNPKHVVGTTPLVPREDNDEKLEWFDIKGESLYSNPPDPQQIHIDHGLDENHIWAFQKSVYNQNIVKNNYLAPGNNRAYLDSHAPFWGHKLAMPHHFKREKLEKFYRHWNHRLGLEILKMQQVRKYGLHPNEKQREAMREEAIQYIEDCYKHEELRQLDDVYVTDHKPVPRKYITESEDADQDFYEYQKAVEEYNNDETSAQRVFGAEKSAYQRGSLLQRAFDPFFGAGKDENGTILCNLDDRDLVHYGLNDEERLRAEFNELKQKSEVWELDEDEEQARLQLFRELQENNNGYDLDKWKEIVAKELGVFKQGEYNFT